jgi:uncharacterized protein (DUF433 family)
MTTKTDYPYVVLGKDGFAIIEGTTTKVIELVEEKNTFGISPEELHLWHPYLSLSQIHAAFAYYWDHQEELDRQIEQFRERAEKWMREREEEHRAFEAGIRAKARAKGIIG